ncbi:fasciclin domain-containing protein [Qipengyuania sp. SM2507]
MNKFTIALASAASLAIVACAEEPADTTAMDDAAMADQMANDDAAMVGETSNIVEVAQGNPDFSTLVAAVTSANLGETLSGPGPYTVFAPTNAAFEKIPQATRDELMSEAGREDLAGILTYHVVEGETMAAALTAAIEGAGTGGYEITTVNGATLTATLVDGNVVLTDAAGNTSTVTGTDVDASNGVIHSIDTVLMPA